MPLSCPTPECPGRLVRSTSLPLTYCSMCSTFTGETFSAGQGVGLYKVLRELCVLETSAHLSRFKLISDEQTLPVVAAYCNKDSLRLVPLLCELNRWDNANTFYAALKSCQTTAFDELKDYWAMRLRQIFQANARDIEYLIEALGYAAGILHKVSEYVAEEFEVPDMNAKVESGSIKVSKSDLVLGDSVTVSWKSCISEKSSKTNKRSKRKTHPTSAELTVTDMVTNESQSYSLGGEGSREFNPEHDTMFKIVFKGNSQISKPQSVSVKVFPPLEIKEFKASSNAIVEGCAVDLWWDVAGCKTLRLVIRDDAFCEETIDVSSQPGNRYTFAPARRSTVTLLARSSAGSLQQASLSIGVTQLPKIPMSMLSNLLPSEIEISSPELPSLDFSFDMLNISSVENHSLLPLPMRDKVRYYLHRLKKYFLEEL